MLDKLKAVSKVYLILDAIIILVVLLCFHFYFIGTLRIEMNQGQILYLYSMEAQVVAGLFALTITGYIFYRHYADNLKERESLHGIIEIHKKSSDKRLIYIAVISFLAIIFSIANIALLNTLSNFAILHSVILTLGTVIGVYAIMNIIAFSINTLNPNFEEISEKELEKQDELPSQGSSKSPEQKQLLLNGFFQFYSALESTIITFATGIQRSTYHDYNGQVNYAKAVRILINNNVIDSSYKDRIDNIIVYRNLLIASGRKFPDYLKYMELRKILNDIRVRTNLYSKENV